MNKVIKKVNASDDAVHIGVDGLSLAAKHDKIADYSVLAFSKDIKAIIASLKRQVQTDIDVREREVQQRIEQAYKEGYLKGIEDGGQQERENRMKSIEALFSEGKSKSDNAIRNLEIKVIDLAVEIAEKLLRKSIELEPESVESMLTEIISYIIGSETVVLKVSAEDYQTINVKYNTWMSMAGSASEFKIEIDKRLRFGDFLIETEGGVINGIVNDRINVLVEALLKVSG